MLIVKSLLFPGTISRIENLFLFEELATQREAVAYADTARPPSRSGVRSKQDDATRASRRACRSL